jgi:hypothetical protein
MRNCTRDEGRPFEVGNQVLISSHRKLLSSKAMVVNVAEKSGQDFDGSPALRARSGAKRKRDHRNAHANGAEGAAGHGRDRVDRR